jgi:hypothetical protein
MSTTLPSVLRYTTKYFAVSLSDAGVGLCQCKAIPLDVVVYDTLSGCNGGMESSHGMVGIKHLYLLNDSLSESAKDFELVVIEDELKKDSPCAL